MPTSQPTSGVLAGASGASDRFSASRRLIARMSTGSAPTPHAALYSTVAPGVQTGCVGRTVHDFPDDPLDFEISLDFSNLHFFFRFNAFLSAWSAP